MQHFGKRVAIVYFGFWPQETKKSPEEHQETLMRSLNSAF
jgi:hypothetical protein